MATSNIDRIESPCIRKCTLDDNDVCVGCFRHIDEICAWGSASNDRRREILQLAAERGQRQKSA